MGRSLLPPNTPAGLTVGGGGEGVMRFLHVWLLGVFLTACVVLPVVRVGWLPGGRVEAAPAAQGQSIGVAAGVYCLSDPICLAAVSVIVGVMIYAGFEVTDMNFDAVVHDAYDWFTGGSDGAEQMGAQLSLHPFYVNMTADMIAELAAEFGAAGDWTLIDFAGGSANAYVRSSVGDRLTLTWDDLAWPWADLGGLTHPYLATSVGEGPGGLDTTSSYAYTWAVYASGCGGSALASASVADFLGGSEAWAPEGSLGNPAYFYPLADVVTPGELYCIQISLPNDAAPVGTGYEWLGASAFRIRTIYYDPSPDVTVTTDVPLWTAIATTEYGDLSGQRAWVPALSWYPTTWDGTSDIPRAIGNTGVLVEPIPTPATEDEAWWEGLFGGLGGKLQGIWEGIQSIGSTATNIWEAVQALPDTMTTALAAAVVPSESVSERTNALRTSALTKAPFAWPAVVFGLMGDLFEGGTDCPTIDFGTEAVSGWPAIDMEMCVPPGAQTILYTITDVVAAALVMVWAFWAYRRLVGA